MARPALDNIEAFAEPLETDNPARQMLLDLVAELRQRRGEDAVHTALNAERVSLKRRLAILRGLLSRQGWGHVVEDDDEIRRRFEAKQRKAARRG